MNDSHTGISRIVCLTTFALAFAAAGIGTAHAEPMVTICHFPPGAPTNVQRITVGASATPAHFNLHGDVTCESGNTDCCFGTNTASVCTNVMADVNNCGACNHRCAAGEACVAGHCTTQCQARSLACNNECVDANTDTSNCGTCGNACTTGQSCVCGECVSACTSDELFCNGECVANNSGNCGECGHACAPDQVCTNGTCGTAADCQPGQTVCDQNCVDTNTDTQNCGTCGHACGPNQSCTSGQCTGICGPTASTASR